MSQDELSRRRFLQTSAAMAGAAVVAPLSLRGQSLPQAGSATQPASAMKRTATDQVMLGNTGIKLSRLGFGTGSENGRTQLALGKDNFVNLIHAAYDKGITFFDSCDRYLSGPLMKDALKGLPREKLYIQSKITGQRDALAAIDAERKKLDVDYFDAVLIHSQTAANWTGMDAWKRVMDSFDEAKEKKWIRANGVSCHNLPALQDATAHPWTQVHQVRVNPQGKYVDGPRGGGYVANETWPVDPVVTEIKTMHEKGRGIIGMKIMGNGLFTDPADREKSIRFAMSMKEINAVVIGFKNPQEIDEAIERINRALAEV